MGFCEHGLQGEQEWTQGEQKRAVETKRADSWYVLEQNELELKNKKKKKDVGGEEGEEWREASRLFI